MNGFCWNFDLFFFCWTFRSLADASDPETPFSYLLVVIAGHPQRSEFVSADYFQQMPAHQILRVASFCFTPTAANRPSTLPRTTTVFSRVVRSRRAQGPRSSRRNSGRSIIAASCRMTAPWTAWALQRATASRSLDAVRRRGLGRTWAVGGSGAFCLAGSRTATAAGISSAQIHVPGATPQKIR